MTERDSPPAEGAPACPFLALADDRDARFDHPDRAHRCYAESPPAPRATAHQITFCLGAAFASCPTFTDWARREVARVKASETWRTAGDEGRKPLPAEAGAAAAAVPGRPSGSGTPPSAGQGSSAPGRAPEQRRDWAAPPPWLNESASAAAGGAAPGRSPVEGPADRAGQAAGHGAKGGTGEAVAAATPRPPGPDADTTPAAVGRAPAAAATPAFLAGRGRPEIPPPEQTDWRASSASGRPRPSSRQRSADRGAPAWEEPRRYEAYPTIRTRVGMPRLSPLLLGVAAVAIAALALFFLPPMFLGLGGGDGSSPTPTVVPSAEATVVASPTPTPAPTPIVYTVKSGDTLSRIAASYGLTVDDILAVNPQVTEPDSINVGDQIVIPQPEPSEIVDTSGGESTPVP